VPADHDRAAGNRPRLVEPLSDFVRRAGIPFFNTQMGKGAVTGGSNLYLVLPPYQSATISTVPSTGPT